MLSFIGR